MKNTLILNKSGTWNNDYYDCKLHSTMGSLYVFLCVSRYIFIENEKIGPEPNAI